MVEEKIFLSELIVFQQPGQAIRTSLNEPVRQTGFFISLSAAAHAGFIFNANLLKPEGLSAVAKAILQWVDPQNKIWPKRF